MQKSILAVAVFALGVATFVGCSGKPSGFPKVKPCEITVVDGGAGVADVEVALIPTTPISGVIAGGKTDASGKCVVNTTFANFTAPGAPIGEFTITLRKDPTPSMPALTVEEMGSMERGDIDKYNEERNAEIQSMPQIVAPNLTSMQTSPLKVGVPDNPATVIELTEYK